MTIKGTTFRKGGVELEVDPSSLSATLSKVDELTREQMIAVCSEYGQEIGEGQPPLALVLITKSFIQNEWYKKFKGEIPMATQKNHEARSKKVAQKVEGGSGNGGSKKTKGEKATKAPRAERTFAFAGKKEDLEGVKGHRGLVAKALYSIKSGKADDVIAAVKSGETKYETKHPFDQSVRGNLAALVRDGLAKIVEA